MSKKDKKQTPVQSQPIAPAKKLCWIPVAILFVVSIGLYINTLRNNYALDDSMVLIRNSFTQSGISGVGDIFKYDTFTGFWVYNDSTKTVEQIVNEKKLLAGGRYRPFSLLTFAVEIQLFGTDFYDENDVFLGQGCPAVNHFMNAFYYALTTILLYLILFRILPSKSDNWLFSLPFIAAMLFAFHPIHTEVVANVKGRDEILTLLGSLAALWCSLKYIDTKKVLYLVLSFFALLIGLFSKENAITFLAIIPITLYYFTNAKWKEQAINFIPLLLAAVLFLAVRASVLGFSQASEHTRELMNDPFINMNFSERYGTIFVTLLAYLKLLIIPHPLTYDYYPWQIPKTELSDGLALLALAIYFAMGIYAVYGMIKKKDLVSYSILLYLIALSPVCNIFFCVGTLMNERFIFISSIGYCIIIAMIFTDLLPKIIKNETFSHYITSIVGIVILLLFAIKVVTRNNDWENDTVLFTTDVNTSAMSAKSNCTAGGRLLEKAKSENVKDNKELHDALCTDAIKYLEKSNKIYCSDGRKGSKKQNQNMVYSDAMLLLGNAYFEMGNVAGAIDSYIKILSVYPQHNLTNQNLRVVLIQTPSMLMQKKTTSTVNDILEVMSVAVKVMPDCGEIYYVLGVLYGRELGDMNASIQCFDKAETCDFTKTSGYYKDLGVAYGISGQYDKALYALEMALKLDPNDPVTYTNLGYTYKNLGQDEKGQSYLNQAEQLKQEFNDKQ
ncbi:MAG: tetratricopeptide repeat protein [Bacteroidales bacterium]|nr:tetratricopeptide repeat protein [Bacteroidales bacterium]